ncbi:helix-turn-helix protein [Chitinophaga skermanii]|uniref:Helix-turn-helix protein n=1 Tax=Chitinophaga skermanii TaxID=331697 RepID=A0A327QNL9_9BACT|nr:helix-turn-helix domain-containing protein [Chitinophaga skermanii]RAJ05252.1 helix-turn-helix protein [Chitinophaga skermanii]
MAIFQSYLPHPALQPFVQAYLLVTSEPGFDNTLLPATHLTLSFRWQGSVALIKDGVPSPLQPFTIAGLSKSSKFIHYNQGTHNFLVSFKNGGASAFFKLPIHLLANQHTNLDDLLPLAWLLDTQEQLALQPNNEQRVAIMDHFLLGLLHQPAIDPLVQAAMDTIIVQKGLVKLSSLAQRLHISTDAFEKRFRKVVGTTAKQFANTTRFKLALQQYDKSKPLTGLAYELGYFDQAHFIKDFKAFTGQVPSIYFKEKE